MSSSYSPLLTIELMATGENSGVWGVKNNTSLSLLEAAIAGAAAVTHDNTANYTLTVNNGTADEARQMILIVGGALTADRNVVCPTSSKLYIVKNNTSGGKNITLKTTGGTGIAVAPGAVQILICDGTNVVTVAATVAVGSITGLGTGVATALAVNVGSAGAPVVFNGALGTPSSGTATNLSGTASALNIGGNAATATTAAACSGNTAGSSGSCTGNAATATTATNLSGGSVAATTITATGNITAYYSSDVRMKKNVSRIGSALDKVRMLRGVRFDWKKKYVKEMGVSHTVGVIAQEVQKVLPEAVAKRTDGMKAVRYELLVPLLIEAVKELSDKVARLEAQQ